MLFIFSLKHHENIDFYYLCLRTKYNGEYWIGMGQWQWYISIASTSVKYCEYTLIKNAISLSTHITEGKL